MQPEQRSTPPPDDSAGHIVNAMAHLPGKGRLKARASIDALEDALRSHVASGEIEQTHHDGATPEGNDEATHYFGDGVYVRGLFIAAGCLVIGKIHRQARVCVVAQGRCTFVDEFSSKTVEAPWAGEFNPGCKTAVYAHTDTMWYACVGTDLKDPIEILNTLAAPSYEMLEQKS